MGSGLKRLMARWVKIASPNDMDMRLEVVIQSSRLGLDDGRGIPTAMNSAHSEPGEPLVAHLRGAARP
jgi:hypothetical protein